MVLFNTWIVGTAMLGASLLLIGVARADPVADAVLKTAKELQKQIPIRSGDSTLVGVAAAGRKLKYAYKMDQNDVPGSWLVGHTPLLRSNVCKHALMSKMMSIGVAYSFMYFDAGNKFVGEVEVTSAHCK